MKIKNIFVLTPIGEEESPERIHADRMNGVVFQKFDRYLFECAIDEHGGSAVVAERIFNKIKEADVVVADMTFGNFNVLYEIGLAHALNKSVILIAPKDFDVPFNLKHLSRIQYDKYAFDSDRNNDIVDRLRKDIEKALQKLESSGKNNLNPYTDLLKETPEEMFSEIKNMMNDLKEVITREQSKDKVVAEYIEGEDAAFEELTNAILNARESIRTTRFSPYTVSNGRQNKFFQAICQVMSRTNPPCPDYFYRIIAANDEEKLPEVLELIRNNMGRNFTIYLSKCEYNFEIVIIDEGMVFIHFRRSGKLEEKDQNKKENLISASLKFVNRGVAREFVKIFDSIIENVENECYPIRCKEITFENVGEITKNVDKEFQGRLKHFKRNTETPL